MHKRMMGSLVWGRRSVFTSVMLYIYKVFNEAKLLKLRSTPLTHPRFLIGLLNGMTTASKALVAEVCGPEHNTVGMGLMTCELSRICPARTEWNYAPLTIINYCIEGRTAYLGACKGRRSLDQGTEQAKVSRYSTE